MPTSELIIITVHGIWPCGIWRIPLLGRRDRWHQRHSSFLSKLESELTANEVSCLIEEFQWSGQNSVIARARAGARLARMIRLVRTNHPSSKIVLLCHSHGGNLAIAATQDDRAQVDAVCTIATPYTRIFHDELLTQFEQVNISYLVVICLLAIKPEFAESVILGLLSLISVVAAASISLAMIPFLKDNALQKRLTEKLIRISEVKTGNTFPLLIIRGAGDFATSSLSFGIALSRLCNRSLRFLYGRVRPKALYPSFACFGMGISLWIAGGTWGRYAAVVALFPLLLLMLSYVVFLVPRFFFRAFAGTELMHPRFACEVDISEAPLQWTTIDYHTITDNASFNAIRHNAYDHPDVPRIVASWLRKVL